MKHKTNKKMTEN